MYEGKPMLGFGLMRLPQNENGIDIEATKKLIDMFMASGFTYFDTARAYAGSEDATRVALVERYPRDSFTLASKLPAWKANTKEEAENMFYESLEHCGVEYFDYYLLHSLSDDRLDKFDEYDLWNFIAQRKAEGKIKNIGFSIHDSADVVDKVLAAHPEVDFIQLQINYNDWESENVQSRKCLEVANKYGKPVVVMEPVKGGALADPPAPVQKIFKAAKPDASCASWALHFVASQPGIMAILSGMNTEEQMADNIATLKDVKPMTAEELAVIDDAMKAFAAIPTIPCTACRYCESGCPMQIKIPDIFSAMNNYLYFNSLTSGQRMYNRATEEGGRASECIGCGQCESVCPQKIGIIEELARTAEILE